VLIKSLAFALLLNKINSLLMTLITMEKMTLLLLLCNYYYCYLYYYRCM